MLWSVNSSAKAVLIGYDALYGNLKDQYNFSNHLSQVLQRLYHACLCRMKMSKHLPDCARSLIGMITAVQFHT